MSKQHPPSKSQSPWSTLASVVGFELALAVLAFILAAWIGIDLMSRLVFDLPALNWAVIATIPLVGVMYTLTQSNWAWVKTLNEPVETYMRPLLKDLPPGGLLLVALAAGIGEELLFRGVIQQGVSDWAGPGLGLVVASVLFGFAHALNRYYVMVTMAMGVYLGLLYQASQNIVLVMLVHALYDWVVLRLFLLKPPPNKGAKY